jgi:hypothetical protein
VIGPGKYDDECTWVRERTRAAGVILIVADGARGWGFSMQAPLDVTVQLPDMLERMAREIRADLDRGKL